MLILVSLVIIGGVAAKFYGSKFLVFISISIFATHLSSWIIYSWIELASIITLFSHLCAVQGGYLIGGYYFHGRSV